MRYFALYQNRPYFDHSKSQTTLNQTSLTKEEANALSRAVATAFRENNGSHDDNSDDPRSDLDTRNVSVFIPNKQVYTVRIEILLKI